MIEWSEQHRAIRDAFRRFVDQEIKPKRIELEHGDLPPYEILRKMFATFGLRDLAEMRFQRDLERAEKPADQEKPREPDPAQGEMVAMQMIPIIELSRHSPGMVTALSVSAGLTAGTTHLPGPRTPQERFGQELLTLAQN